MEPGGGKGRHALSPHSRQSSLVPVSGGCWHSSARSRASDGSSFQPPGCRGGPAGQARLSGPVGLTSTSHYKGRGQDDLFQNRSLPFNCC